jgi:hypothetical protein
MNKTFGDAQPLAARSAGYAAPDPVDKIADKNLLKRRMPLLSRLESMVSAEGIEPSTY